MFLGLGAATLKITTGTDQSQSQMKLQMNKPEFGEVEENVQAKPQTPDEVKTDEVVDEVPNLDQIINDDLENRYRWNKETNSFELTDYNDEVNTSLLDCKLRRLGQLGKQNWLSDESKVYRFNPRFPNTGFSSFVLTQIPIYDNVVSQEMLNRVHFNLIVRFQGIQQAYFRSGEGVNSLTYNFCEVYNEFLNLQELCEDQGIQYSGDCFKKVQHVMTRLVLGPRGSKSGYEDFSLVRDDVDQDDIEHYELNYGGWRGDEEYNPFQSIQQFACGDEWIKLQETGLVNTDVTEEEFMREQYFRYKVYEVDNDLADQLYDQSLFIPNTELSDRFWQKMKQGEFAHLETEPLPEAEQGNEAEDEDEMPTESTQTPTEPTQTAETEIEVPASSSMGCLMM